MKPALRVLITVPDNADVLVRNEKLDVAGPPLLACYDGGSLVFGGVPVPVQMLLCAKGEEAGVEMVRDGFVVTALHGKHFALG